jgi:hypothetical protein
MQAHGRRGVIVSGGGLTVTIRGKRRGGPNQEYALALAQALQGTPGISAIAGGTDGTDGGCGSPDDPAGAFIDDTTLARAKKLGLDPAAFLAENDSTGFSNVWAICFNRDRLIPMSTISALYSLRGIRARSDFVEAQPYARPGLDPGIYRAPPRLLGRD